MSFLQKDAQESLQPKMSSVQRHKHQTRRAGFLLPKNVKPSALFSLSFKMERLSTFSYIGALTLVPAPRSKGRSGAGLSLSLQTVLSWCSGLCFQCRELFFSQASNSLHQECQTWKIKTLDSALASLAQ